LKEIKTNTDWNDRIGKVLCGLPDANLCSQWHVWHTYIF